MIPSVPQTCQLHRQLEWSGGGIGTMIEDRADDMLNVYLEQPTLIAPLQPTSWTNDYFINLKSFEWQEFKGPGKKIQWKVS